MSLVKPDRLESFMQVYSVKLMEVVADTKQTDYAYGPDEVPGVVTKMRSAFVIGNYNIDGRAIDRTCRALRIKRSYKAIRNYLTGED